MRTSNRKAQKLDVTVGKLRTAFPGIPIRIQEIVETWKGKGWGFRFERHRTETTATIDDEENTNERS